MRLGYDICQPSGELSESESALAQCFMAIAGFVRKMSGTTELDTDSMNRTVSKMVEEALKYNQVESFRSFSNEKERIDYIYLLQKEKALIDNVQDSLQNKAMKLYQKCIAKPDSSLAARCCNFKMLEEKCSSYFDT